MKINKTALLCVLLIILTAIISPLKASGADEDTVGDMLGGILSFKQGGKSTQGYIDTTLCDYAGQTSEWYIMTLAQSGSYSFGGYEKALLEYLKNTKVASATSREKYALALISIGSENEYIINALNDSIGAQGLMSLVFGLHILNNGYIAENYTQKTLAEKILALQLKDGGFAVMGDNGDVDCTAMTLQALAPMYKTDSKVKSACDKAIAYLSKIQQSDGGYMSFGVSNCESLSQVILALACLGIDPEKDTRFIKNGNTLIDALAGFRLSDGSFCHAKDGGFSESATVQALYTLCGVKRLRAGKGSFYIFDKRSPETVNYPAPAKVTTVTTQAGSKTTTSSKAATSGKRTTAATKQSSSSGGGTSPQKATTTTKSLSGSGGEVTTYSSAASSSNMSSASSDGASGSASDKSEAGTSSASEEISSSEPSQTVTSLPDDTDAPSAEVTSDTDSSSDEKKSVTSQGSTKSGKNVKVYLYIAAAVLAGAGIIVLIIRGKKNIKSYIFIIAVGAAVCAVVYFLDIQTPDEYYAPPQSNSNEEDLSGSVTISVDCLVLVGEQNDLIPADGYLVKTQQVSITENETAYDLLVDIARQNGILLDVKGGEDMIYVAGIGGLYEYDFGELSGWMYYVNGKAPSVNASQYTLSDGDTVEWRYTREIGHDHETE